MRNILILTTILTSAFIHVGISHADESTQSLCGDESAKHEVRISNVHSNTVKARQMLAVYDASLQSCLASSPTDREISQLNQTRGNIIRSAISAYFFGGPMDYPDDNKELLASLTATDETALNHLQVPESLEQLVEIGLLPHLPASPYATGKVLSELSAYQEAGDMYYNPILVSEASTLLPEPGLEGNLLLIFDHQYSGNDLLFTFSQLDEEFPGDLTKFVEQEGLDNICYIYGSDPDSW